MSVYLKCKADGSTFKIEGKTTADKPYLAMNYTTQTGSESSQTTMSKAYFPLTTNTEFVIPNKKVALKVSSTKYYVANNTNTTTTTIESTETKFTGTAYIPVGEPILTSTAPIVANTSSDCGGVSAGWVTTKYVYDAVNGISYTATRYISSVITDYYSHGLSATLFKNTSNVTTVNESTYSGIKIRSESSKAIAMTDTAIPIITARANNAYMIELANNKYIGLFSQTRYSTSSSYAGYNNTLVNRFPYRASYSIYDYNYSIYSSYESNTVSGTSFDYSCSIYTEEVVTKTIITSITD